MRWARTVADLGSHAIAVTDELGVSEVQPLALSVEADAEALVVELFAL